MKRSEFDLYFNLISQKQTIAIINGESLSAISELRNKAVVARARIGQELALMKNMIQGELITLIDVGKKPVGYAKEKAELLINGRNEVSRRELQYLREVMHDF